MPQVTGRVYISVGGRRLRSKPGATLDIGGVSRTAVTSDSGVDGYTEATTAPVVNCTISHTADISLAELGAITDETLRFQTDTGVGFTIRSAWCASPPVLGAGGEVTLVFNGVECIEG
ncbi:phage tail tube protein [Bordetella ansorpii]|uniref:Phage tail tube protein n=1 Tax=Bordetella ansorpii TaxID=288768 RepID=A0A157SVU3_9BORD|nr:phage tail tube protein [Bordetella ansorpii]SAI74567.1 phage tail tube protein [Bordetella ansorpii]